MIKVKTFEDFNTNFEYDGRAIYLIHIPKTGGTSFNCKYLKNKGQDHMFCVANVKRLSVEQGGWQYHLTPYWKKYRFNLEPNYKISIVRNPFDLLTSYYFHNSDDDNGWANVNYIHNIDSFEDFIYKFCNPDFKWHVPQFKKFLFSQLFNENGQCVPDIIIKYEYLSEAYNMLNIKGLRINTKIHTNKSNEKNKNYYEYYSNDMIELINDFCKRELNMFDYDFMNTNDTIMYINPDFKYDVHNDVILD